jgi:hypothetical protein
MMRSSADASIFVLLWWVVLSIVGIINLVSWLLLARELAREQGAVTSPDLRSRRWQLVLSGIYVVGCAFRSFLPRADVQRICFVDSIWSSVFIGRTVATLAELAFALQIALTLREIARELRLGWAIAVSHLTLPLILVAEVCSWYAVLTTNYRGNLIEQSLWTVNGLLMCLAAGALWWRSRDSLRRWLGRSLAGGLIYLGFMLAVDLPMYFMRMRADEGDGRPYLGLQTGLADVIHRRVVTFRWADWHEELAWMLLYFSVVVWFSMALVNAPRLWHRSAQ